MAYPTYKEIPLIREIVQKWFNEISGISNRMSKDIVSLEMEGLISGPATVHLVIRK